MIRHRISADSDSETVAAGVDPTRGDHRFRGLRYQTRFTTGPRPNAVALFDQAGVHDWPLDQQPTPGVAACRQAGLNAAQNPTRRYVTIVDPPR
ncbi:hypothetical protein [Mycolicibacterium palauense]|uniref:hypothetical protein n=1 Tax=Mycolicibacterium palauense TaxID=2034511 RepID=UPI001145F56D|nr:hypothetical protein [Mycolicibacterium palauense]